MSARHRGRVLMLVELQRSVHAIIHSISARSGVGRYVLLGPIRRDRRWPPAQAFRSPLRIARTLSVRLALSGLPFLVR